MKRAKQLSFTIAATCCFALALSACGGNDGKEKLGDAAPSEILVAYFSCTGNTERAAEYVADATGGTLYEIVPEQPYTADDLDYRADCRANVEQNDETARPAIGGTSANMADYRVVFLGYPIWWSEAPKIMYTFLESYDFSGKTIVPFCTSGSSGIGSSAENMHGSASGATWLTGKRFSSSVSKADVEDWIDSLTAE